MKNNGITENFAGGSPVQTDNGGGGVNDSVSGSGLVDSNNSADQSSSDSIESDIDSFFQQYPDAINYGEEIANELDNCKNWEGIDTLVKAYIAVLTKKCNDPGELLNNEDFINNQILNNPAIREKILNDFFSKVPASVKLPKGAGIPSAPKSTPRSIEEAGKILEQILKSN